MYAGSKRVLKDWRNLVINNFMKRIREIAFAMRKIFKGGWEYRVNQGDCFFYKPIKETKEVIVYYADKHPRENKYPPAP